MSGSLTSGRHLAAAGSEGGANLLEGVVAVDFVVVASVAAVGVAADVGLGGLLAGELLRNSKINTGLRCQG